MALDSWYDCGIGYLKQTSVSAFSPLPHITSPTPTPLTNIPLSIYIYVDIYVFVHIYNLGGGGGDYLKP